ncbi:MAG: protoporphyrinogen oxidase [Verrucomicrobia bacterium]|nr:protoporphyrinogen oxidase [Verrucomicrobiota bacterium]
MSSPAQPASPGAKSIAVLGAGATGLTAAYRLAQRGHQVRVFEVSDRVGGAVRTESVDGWLIEGGPNSMLAGEPALAALVEELGLAPELIAASPAAKNRYIVRGGRPVAAPASPPALFGSPLFSFGAKVRLLSEIFSRRRVRKADVSLEEFVRDHFGQELVDYGLNPFVSGVYAGNPKKLSARHSFPKLWELEQTHGSIIRGQIAEAKARKASGKPRAAGGIVSFRRGLQTLPAALAARLPAGALSRLAQIEALVPGKPWNVVWHDGTATHNETFDAVVAALPAPALAQLRFGTLGEKPLASLDGIEHPPVTSLFLGYRRDQVAHPLDGFGVLVPEIEKRSVLGILFSSSLFPGRAPEGHVALTVMAGGARQPEIARLPADKFFSAVEPDLRQLLGVNGAPVFQRHTFWPRAIPQYNLGHEAHLDTMAAVERTHPGFFIGGQARDGIALPACLAAGEKLAARVLA